MARFTEKAHENEFSAFLDQYSFKSALLHKQAISEKKPKQTITTIKKQNKTKIQKQPNPFPLWTDTWLKI